MPRLDATRLEAWRQLTTLLAELHRGVDEDLLAEWDIPVAWFEVLSTLQRLGGRARPTTVADELRLPPSSLSRRLDRLEDEGWIARHRDRAAGDGRAVTIELTRRGRKLWREMNVSYRRSVQSRFSIHLDDADIAAIHDVVVRLLPEVDDHDEFPDQSTSA